MRVLDLFRFRVLFLVFLIMALLAPTLTVEAKAPDERRLIDVPTVPAADDAPDVASPRPVSDVPIVNRVDDVVELVWPKAEGSVLEDLLIGDVFAVQPARVAQSLDVEASSPLTAVVENSDGSISVVASELPVRTFDKTAETWVPIDLVLQYVADDGWVSPVAGLVDVSISVGAPGPSDGAAVQPVPVAEVTIDDGSKFVIGLPQRSVAAVGRVVTEQIEPADVPQLDRNEQFDEVAAIAVADERSSVKIEEIFDNGMDFEIEATAVGAKWTYEVPDLETALEAALIETLEIPQGWSVEESSGSVLLLDPDGELGGMWTGGPVFDSSDLDSAELQITGTHAAIERVCCTFR